MIWTNDLIIASQGGGNMEDLAEKKLAKLREIAKLDSSYSSILQRYLVLEKQFSDMTTTLSREQEDLIWEFVCTSDELDRRLLEIACEYIWVF